MADLADLAQERLEREETARAKYGERYTLPEGTPGDCDLCGEWSGRLVEGACAPCRDRIERDRR